MSFENVSQGWIPGFLGPPLFNTTPLGNSAAILSWDLTGTPYIFNYLFVGGFGIVNMYQVSADELKVGVRNITVDGLQPILAVGIYGSPRIATPDNGSTTLLFALALMALCFFGSKARAPLRCVQQ